MRSAALERHQEELSRAVRALEDQWRGVEDVDAREEVFDRVTNLLFRKHSMLAAAALTAVYRAFQTEGPVTTEQLLAVETCAKAEVILWYMKLEGIRVTCQEWAARYNPWQALPDCVRARRS